MDLPTFKEMMNEVVAYGSCCACGTCVLVCPHNVIRYVDGKPLQVAKASAAFDYCGMSEGIGCDVCAQVCPRLGVREFGLKDSLFKDGRPHEDVFGVYRKIVAARCKETAILERCQDGGVVTALLAHARRTGRVDGAIVSVADPTSPCSPQPRVVMTAEEIRATAGSWYTYCPNNLALAEAAERGLSRIAFVGVPCQITPNRKMELADPGFLDNGRKKPKHIERQRGCLKGYAPRIAINIGLLCSEVFTYEGLMAEKIEREMEIPLREVRKFNVKGKVLIYKASGEVVELKLRRAQEYARPECHHCGDFTAELADISCGGVGAMDWTITIVRTKRGEDLFDDAVTAGVLETRSMDGFETSMRVMRRLALKQRARVPVPPGRPESYVRPVDGDHGK